MLPFLQYLLHVLELRSHLTWLIWCRSSDPARRPRMKRRSEGRGGPVGGGRPSEQLRRREDPAGAKGTPRPRCPRGRSGKRFGRCECVPLGRPSGERNARSLRSVPLGGCSESAVLDPMQPVPDSGDREPSRFLGGKQLEKPETDSIIAERPCERKGFGASPPKVFGIVSRNPKPAP